MVVQLLLCGCTTWTLTKRMKKKLDGNYSRMLRTILNKSWRSLLIAAQNNAIRTIYVKAKVDNSQQNSKCRLCCDRDETINHTARECRKFAQKEYKTRHKWVRKVIHWELCKKFKFDHTTRWYMHNQESVSENETDKLL